MTASPHRDPEFPSPVAFNLSAEQRALINAIADVNRMSIASIYRYAIEQTFGAIEGNGRHVAGAGPGTWPSDFAVPKPGVLRTWLAHERERAEEYRERKRARDARRGKPTSAE